MIADTIGGALLVVNTLLAAVAAIIFFRRARNDEVKTSVGLILLAVFVNNLGMALHNYIRQVFPGYAPAFRDWLTLAHLFVFISLAYLLSKFLGST